MNQQPQKKIGAIWQRKSAKGFPYLSGSIEIDGKKLQFAAFPNKKEGNEKRPDWNIIESIPRENKPLGMIQNAIFETQKQQEDIDITSIPF